MTPPKLRSVTTHAILDTHQQKYSSFMEPAQTESRSKHKGKLQFYLNMTRNSMIKGVKRRRERSLLTDLIQNLDSEHANSTRIVQTPSIDQVPRLKNYEYGFLTKGRVSPMRADYLNYDTTRPMTSIDTSQ